MCNKNDINESNASFEIVQEQKKNSRALYHFKAGILFFSCLYVFLFFGAFYGYGPMILLLKEDDAFLSKCPGNETQCLDQTRALLNVHFTATFLQVLSPLVGHLYDAKGAFAMMIYTTITAMIGIGVLILSRGIHVDELLYVSFCFLGLASYSPMIVVTAAIFGPKSQKTNATDEGEHERNNTDEEQEGYDNEEGEEFKDNATAHISDIDGDGDKAQRRVVALLNNLFDAGSVTYLFLLKIQQATEASLQAISYVYLGVAIFSFGGALLFWKLFLTRQRTSRLPADVINRTEESEIPLANKDKFSSSSSKEKKSNWKALRSTPFLWLLLFFVYHQCRNLFMLTSAEAFLEYLGDSDDRYITIFTSIMPASIIGFPFVDFVLNRYGYHTGLQMINVLAIIHGIIQVSTTNLQVQIVGFIVYSFYRCFLFSITFAFLLVLLPGNVIGKANGIMFLSAGIASLWNILLGNITMKQLDGNFFVVNLVYTVGTIPLFYATYRMTADIRNCSK